VDPDGQGSARPGGTPAIGTVTEQLPSGLYKVKLDEGSAVTAHIAGRLDRNFIRLLVGDRVKVEITAADAGRGRIVEKIL
jgi:translation initiation factor IF-1